MNSRDMIAEREEWLTETIYQLKKEGYNQSEAEDKAMDELDNRNRRY